VALTGSDVTNLIDGAVLIATQRVRVRLRCMPMLFGGILKRVEPRSVSTSSASPRMPGWLEAQKIPLPP
jgi:hypothetical protein